MGSVFITYGAKAGGGPPFLTRQRSAYAQVQQRTRSGSSYNQLQTRTRTCYCSSSSSWGWTNYGYTGDCGYLAGESCPPTYSGNVCFEEEHYYSWYGTGPCSQVGCYDSWTAYCYFYYVYEEVTTYSCYLSGWSGWSNTGSCSANSFSCNSPYWSGQTHRECRTVSACNWGNWSAWSNVSSCSPSSSCGSNGGRECQTIYLWGNWSDWQEAETCTPQSPAASNGAIQIECQPN